MNIFEIILIDLIFITFPLILYLFYIAYNQNIGKKENKLIFDLTLITSLYLLIRYGKNTTIYNPLIISSVPLAIAYYKKDKLSSILLSIFIIVDCYYSFSFNIPFMIFEYLLYYIIFTILFKKDKNTNAHINLFIILKSFFTTAMLWQVDYYGDKSSSFVLMGILVTSIILFVIIHFVFILMDKGEEIIRYHMSIKELEKEKQVRTSLFKITHEIKNPMAVCKGYLDMLDTSDKKQVERYVPIIKEEIDRTLLILKDFLSLNKIKIEKDIMDINLLVEEVIDSVSPLTKQNKIIIEENLIDDEVYINGDYNRLKQVLINLVKNSMEAINKDDGKIFISTNLNNNNFYIFIEDNGCGMSEEILSKIEEPFYTTKKNGTGLGISLSKEILEAHNFKIEYKSNENVGTSVTITIPLDLANKRSK